MRTINPKKSANHPTFLVDDDSQESPAYCLTCIQYQQDISILQQKLMQTHNKLIEQIDLTRIQQDRIKKLAALNQKGQQNNRQNINIIPKTQSGKIFKKNQQQNTQPPIQSQTQLLRNDLQAMRSKVLSEINKSNRLIQVTRELEQKHQRQVNQYRQKVKRLQANKSKLLDQKQQLIEQIQQMKIKAMNYKPSMQCTCGFQNRYYELDRAFMNQRTITNQIIEQNSFLKNRMNELCQQRANTNNNNEYNNYRQHRVEETPPPPSAKYQREKHQKQQFEATKNFIKKLQQAQHQMRNRII